MGQGNEELTPESGKGCRGREGRTLDSSLDPSQVEVGSDGTEEFGGAQKGQRWIGREGLSGEGKSSSVGLKVSPSQLLSNHSHTHTAPPAKASFHAKLFITATQQHCMEVSEPIRAGRVDR